MPHATLRRSRLLLSVVAALVLLAPAITAFRSPPDEGVLRRIVQSIQRYYGTARPEKAYLHLDKDLYTVGETIWFKAYVVDAVRHRPDTLSRVLYVELLNEQNEPVLRRTLRLEAGLAPGDMALPDTLSSGNYTLRAYTSWMRNAGPDYFYHRRLAIWPAAPVNAPDSNPPAVWARAAAARRVATAVATPPDVQFFHEGGNLVAGLESVVAFKATDYAGHGLEVQGQVLDAQNRPVATFRSSHLGMGTFSMTPVAGQRYHAEVVPAHAAPRTVPLPAVQASGYIMRVFTLANDFMVGIRQQGGPGGPVVLLGQVRGTVAYAAQGQLAGTETFAARIPKSKFPAGIVHFTLFDGAGVPLAERLVFAQTEPALQVTLTPDRGSYGPRQPVRVRVAVANAAGQPVATNLSLAVTDASAGLADASTIGAHLLLTSDLTGDVENPGYYFQNPTSETAQHLDVLLLTQGWRRFVWKQLLAGKPPVRDFGVEQTLGILGQVTQPNGKPVPGSKLTFLETSPVKQILSTTTNDEGFFLINGFGGYDTTSVTLQARTGRDGRNVVVHLDDGPPTADRPPPPLPLQAPPDLVEALHHSQEQLAAERKFRRDTTMNVMLGGVTVKGTKAPPTDLRRAYPSGTATVIKMSDNVGSSNTTVLEALRSRVPGVSVSGTEPNLSVQIRGTTSLAGGTSPLFLLDGVIVDVSALANYPASEVETIEVLKGGAAAIFGSRGGNGVIAVYTRRGSPTYNRNRQRVAGVAALKLPGYYRAREFYVPRYGSAKTNQDFPDPRRTTLYWNPTVRTDATGQAEIQFFSSDATGRFLLHAEGLSGAGQPAQGSGTLQVK